MMKKRYDGFNFIYEFICAISFSSFNFYSIYLYPQLAWLFFYLIYLQFIHFFKSISAGLLIFLSSIENLYFNMFTIRT